MMRRRARQLRIWVEASGRKHMPRPPPTNKSEVCLRATAGPHFLGFWIWKSTSSPVQLTPTLHEEQHPKMVSGTLSEASGATSASSRPQSSLNTSPTSTGGPADRGNSSESRRSHPKNSSRGKPSRGRGGRGGKARDLGRSTWR